MSLEALSLHVFLHHLLELSTNEGIQLPLHGRVKLLTFYLGSWEKDCDVGRRDTNRFERGVTTWGP